MYKIDDSKMFYDICDNRAIVINSETGIYYGINNFSASVFEMLLQGVSTQDILAAILQIPGLPADMEQRLTTFINELKEKEIIIEGPTQTVAVNILESGAVNDHFALSIIEYSDAQEMLLADPIHEDMEEFEGWQPDAK